MEENVTFNPHAQKAQFPALQQEVGGRKAAYLDGPGGTSNEVDAAFVLSSDALVSDNIQGLGTQGNAVVAAFVGQVVWKSGKTSGVTKGEVIAINTTVDVGYGTNASCGYGTFSNQIIYEPLPPDTTMSKAGDSGSPVVDASNNAVALNFAGNNYFGVGCPMGRVLELLDVSLCASVQGPTIFPEIPTECPEIPTECPSGPTACPVVPTACPVVPTACPVVPTECPEIPTECPELPTFCPLADYDNDGIFDCEDNCAWIPNASVQGTCVKTVQGIVIGMDTVCISDSDCEDDETCDKTQGDFDANSTGDACECYADITCDTKVDLSDLVILKSGFLQPCPCPADLNDDDRVDLSDLVVMKMQFLQTDCPSCP